MSAAYIIITLQLACFSPDDCERLQDSIAQAIENRDTIAECTAEEHAEYERNGWDAYECDGDKAIFNQGEQP